MKVQKKANITDKQWEDVMFRLSHLEERDCQSQDDIDIFKKSLQSLDAKAGDNDKRRQYQFLALQENNVLLLQHIESFKEEITSTIKRFEKCIEEMRNEKQKFEDRISQVKKMTPRLEKRKPAATMKKTMNRSDNKKCTECSKRIVTVYKCLHRMKKQVRKCRKWQYEEFSRLKVEMKETIGSDMLSVLLQAEMDTFCESNETQMNASNKTTGKKLPPSSSRNQMTEVGMEGNSSLEVMKEGKNKLQCDQTTVRPMQYLSILRNSLDGNSMTRMKDDGEDTGSKWQDMLLFLKAFLTGIGSSYKSREAKTEDTIERISQIFQETIDGKIKAFEKKSMLSLDPVKQNIASLKSDLLALETKLNWKFQENYESQLKLLFLKINRKFQEIGSGLPHKMDKQIKVQDISTDQAEADHKLKTNEGTQMGQEQKLPYHSEVEKKILLDHVERFARKVCNEQKVLLRAELDQKLQGYYKKQSDLGSDLEKKVDTQCICKGTNHISMSILKQEVSDHFQVSQKYMLKELYSRMEKMMQECSSYLQIEMNNTLMDSVATQRQDLLAVMDRTFQVKQEQVSDLLHCSLEEKIKEATDCQISVFQTTMNRKFEEKKKVQMTNLLAEMNGNLEILSDNLMKSALTHVEQNVQEYIRNFETRFVTQKNDLQTNTSKGAIDVAAENISKIVFSNMQTEIQGVSSLHAKQTQNFVHEETGIKQLQDMGGKLFSRTCEKMAEMLNGREFEKKTHEMKKNWQQLEVDINTKVQDASQAVEIQMSVVKSHLEHFRRELDNRSKVMHNFIVHNMSQDQKIDNLQLRISAMEFVQNARRLWGNVNQKLYNENEETNSQSPTSFLDYKFGYLKLR